MGELAEKVAAIHTMADRVRRIVAEVQEIGDLRDRLDLLKDSVDRLAQLTLPAVALSVPTAALSPSLEQARDAVGALTSAINKAGGSLPKPNELQTLRDKLDGLSSDLRTEIRQAWSAFKDQQISLGVLALLEAAETLRIPGARSVRTQLSTARQWVEPPHANDVTDTRVAIARYEEIRSQISGGDEQLEAFIIEMTGGGVTLQQFENSPGGRKWLEDNNLLNALFVVMKNA